MTPARTVKSAERTLALLELFSRERRPLAVGEVSSSLAIPQPSASMLLHSLKVLGYLHHEAAGGRFVPTIRVALLGNWVDRLFAESGVGTLLDRLQTATGETVFLGIQNGAAAQYVMVQRVSEPDRPIIASGLYRSLTRSALGRALLMPKTDAEITRLLRRSNTESDRAHIVDPRTFLPLIRRFRAQGYAETRGDSVPESSAIAMPFMSPTDKSPLAVGVGGPTDRIVRKRTRIADTLLLFCKSAQLHEQRRTAAPA
ncbi:helix-turn-helix domain-containing protein [uncultured Reyranella sp.]|uniref:IclR family transcriptional regulator n=1 Tax=uncultured Reyranella sp. TaxID=735512 RepID=UPI0025ED5C28|nr:helix-turn-helix domain-containing protein [uncultured Reyranella sp.]